MSFVQPFVSLVVKCFILTTKFTRIFTKDTKKIPSLRCVVTLVALAPFRLGFLTLHFELLPPHSNRNARTGFSRAARMAGRTPERTAMASVPATTLTIIIGSSSVGICENM